MNKIQLRLDPGKVVYRITAEDTEIVIVYTWPDDSDIFYGTKISEAGATQIAGFKKENYKEFTGEILFTCGFKYKKETLEAEAFENIVIECDMVNDEQMKHIFRIAIDSGIEIMSMTRDSAFKYFRYSPTFQAYSNFIDYNYQTLVHYTDFIKRIK